MEVVRQNQEHIYHGLTFRGDKHRIKINRTGDGNLWIQDGHSRVAALYLCNCKYIWVDEYILEEHSYKDYMTINMDIPWTTPYNLVTEVRKSDLSEWRKVISEIIKTESVTYSPSNKLELISKKFILKCSYKYSEPRVAWHIKDCLNE